MKKLIIIAFIISLLACVKDECDFPGDYEFVVYGEVIPYDSVYHVGDTITLSYASGRNIYESKTNAYYNLNIDEINMSTQFRIFKIDTINDGSSYGVTKYVELFDSSLYQWILDDDECVNQRYISYPITRNDSIFHELKINLKSKGLFVFRYGLLGYKKKADSEGLCRRKELFIFSSLNMGKDNNIELLYQSPNEHYNQWVLQNPEQRFKGGFAYRVID